MTARLMPPLRVTLHADTARLLRAYTGELPADAIHRAVLMLAMADGKVDTLGRVISERAAARRR